MAYSITYNAAFSTGPAKTEKLGLAYVHINDARVAFQERLKSEHEFDLTHNASQGFHKEGSARAFLQASAPTVGEQTALASATADLNSGRVWIASGNGSVFYQTLANANVAGWTAVNAVKREGDTSTALAGNLVYNFLTYSDTLTHESQLIFKKSHWDTAAHAVTLTGEALGSVWAYGDSGSAFTQAGYIQFVQNGAAGAQTPADLVVYLSNGTATAEKFRVSAAGLVTMADLTVTNAITGSITGNAATVTAENEATDTSCFLGFVTAATGSLGIKTNAALQFNSAIGNLGVGGASATNTRIYLSGAATGATTMLGVFDTQTIASGVTTGYRCFETYPSTAAASFTLASLIHFHAAGVTVGAGSAVTNQYGFYVGSGFSTGGTNYGFHSDLSASTTTRWNCYMAGSAPNYFAGKIYVGSPTDAILGSTVSPALQISQLTGLPLGISRWENAASGPYIMIGKSRGSAVGTNVIVQAADALGHITFCGDDGTDMVSVGAQISCYVDGTPGANDMPGALYFETTTDGAANASTKMVLKSDGKLLLGGLTVSLAIAGYHTQIQSVSTSASLASYGAAAFSNDASGARLLLGKSRGTSLGSYTSVKSGDELGILFFAGADGTDMATPGAYIQAKVDGTPGSNDLPTSLIFATTPDGAASPTEKLRITPDGRIYGTALHNNAGAVTGATNQYIASGTYTPTLTAVDGCSASGTTLINVARWTRTGNIVRVEATVKALDVTDTGDIEFTLSLPIASALTSVDGQLSGTLTSVAGYCGVVIGAAASDTADCFIASPGTGSDIAYIMCNFSYEVL